jgi:hypothetical protein
MSRQEYHKGKLKRVNLAEFDNDKEKYFEARYRDEFGANENCPNGLTEEEIQDAYQRSLDNKYRRRGAWEDLWRSDTDCYCAVIGIRDELWEVADIELDDNEDVFTKVSDDEYEYYTSFYNGGYCLDEALEYGLENALKRDNK